MQGIICIMKYTGLASGAGWTLLAIYAHYSGMSIGDRQDLLIISQEMLHD